MRILLLTFLIILSSCSLQEKVDGKSEITPLAQAKTLKDKLEGVTDKDGNAIIVNLKVPLTKNTIGHYALNDIMNAGDEGEPEVNADESEVENLTPKQKSMFSKMIDSLKYKVYNMGLGLGISNRVSYSTEYEFPELDPEYFKEVRVKNIFFAIEPCDEEDAGCLQRQADKPVTFMFLDKFFVNLSAMTGEHEEIKDPLLFLEKNEFNKKVDRAWGVQPLNFKSFKDENGEIPDHVFQNVNIAKVKYSKKMSREQKRNVRDNGKMFIAKVEKDKINSIKDFFSQDEFSGIVKDVTILGKSIYIELIHSQLREKFFETIKLVTTDLRSEGVVDLAGCTNLNCTSLTVNQIDLVPMLQKSRKIKIDTYLSLKHLDWNDFKYSGYIEIQVKLELPLI